VHANPVPDVAFRPHANCSGTWVAEEVFQDPEPRPCVQKPRTPPQISLRAGNLLRGATRRLLTSMAPALETVTVFIAVTIPGFPFDPAFSHGPRPGVLDAFLPVRGALTRTFFRLTDTAVFAGLVFTALTAEPLPVFLLFLDFFGFLSSARSFIFFSIRGMSSKYSSAVR